jgi:hypothetical protein
LERDERHEQETHSREPGRGSDESGVIVFGGGNGCSGRGCLFWILISIVLSVALIVLLNLVVYLF